MGEASMVGRERELRRALDAATRPGCSGVVLVGDAGVGKSVLATTIATRLIAEGADLIRVVATRASAAIPLGAVAPLLSLQHAPATQADVIRHTVAALAARAERHRLVVVVDDGHLLDDASATMVHHLALARTAFLIVTVRLGEPVTDSLTALWKDGLADRLDIDTLGLAESTALAALELGNPLHPAAAAAVFEASGGNPLFIQQLVATARDAGQLVLLAGRGPMAGGWSLIGPLPLPKDLVSAVEARLEHLDDEDRSIIELLALGEPLGATMLERLAGPDADQRLERLETAGFIAADQDQRRLNVRLAHPMFGEVLRATMPTSWANRARIMLADAVESCGWSRRGDALRVALWRLDAHASIPAPIATAAAHQALLLFDPELAERIVRRSDGGADGAPGSIGALADPEAAMLLASIAALGGRGDVAIERLDALDALLDSVDHDGRTRAHATVLRFDVLSYTLGRFEEAYALQVPADGDPAAGTELAARKAILSVTIARPRLAEALLANLPEPQPGTRAEVWVALARAMTAAARGRSTEALAMVDRAAATFDDLGWDPSLPDPAIISYVRIRAMQQFGRLDEAGRLADRDAQLERDQWSAQGVAWVRFAASSVHRMQGDMASATASAIASAATFDSDGLGQLAVIALAELAAARAACGDPDGAQRAANRCDELGVDNFYSQSASAWAVVASGRTTEGVDLLAQVLASRRGREAREELFLVLDIVRLGGAATVVAKAEALAKSSDGPLSELVARFAVAAAHGDAAALRSVAQQFAELGFVLPAAEAMSMATAAFIRGGEARRARSCGTDAAAMRAALTDVASPALLSPAVHAALTSRALEVAAMAATGVTSRAIAAALGLTQRTVESYLQDAYDRLGVSGRPALAEAMGVVTRR